MVTETAIAGFLIFMRRRFRDMKKFWRNFRKYRAIISENRRLKNENQRLIRWKGDLTDKLLAHRIARETKQLSKDDNSEEVVPGLSS